MGMVLAGAVDAEKISGPVTECLPTIVFEFKWGGQKKKTKKTLKIIAQFLKETKTRR